MPVLLLMLGALLPVAIAPGLLFHYDVSPKTIVLAFSASIALSRWRAIPEELAALWSRRGGRILATLAGLQIVWISIATATSTRPWFSLFGSQWRQFGAITVIAMLIAVVLVTGHLCLHVSRVRTLMRTLVCAGIVLSIYGIAQYFDLDPFLSASTYHAQSGDSVIVRPPGTLAHADYFAWWLAIEFFCGIALARYDDSLLWRNAGLACTAFTAVAILFSGTRAAMLAVAIGLAALVAMTGWQVRRRQVFAGLAVITLFAAFYVSPPGSRLRARAAWSGDEPTGGARPLLWRDSLRMAASKPVFGYGPETFQSAFGKWESQDLARLYPDFHHESPHNIALDALTSTGVPGLLLVFAWGALICLAAERARRVQSPIAAPLTAAIIASAVASMFDAASLAPVLLTLLALSVLVALEPPGHLRRPERQPLFGRALCAAGAALLALFAVSLAVSDFKLGRFQKKPDRESYETARKWRLPGAAEDIYCSRILLNACQGTQTIPARIECWRIAEQAAAEAVNTADDPANAWYSLALFTALPNDLRGTEMALKRAIGAAPAWFKPHWSLAKLLAQTGNIRSALPEAERAAILDGNHDPEVAATLAELQAAGQ